MKCGHYDQTDEDIILKLAPGFIPPMTEACKGNKQTDDDSWRCVKRTTVSNSASVSNKNIRQRRTTSTDVLSNGKTQFGHLSSLTNGVLKSYKIKETSQAPQHITFDGRISSSASKLCVLVWPRSPRSRTRAFCHRSCCCR